MTSRILQSLSCEKLDEETNNLRGLTARRRKSEILFYFILFLFFFGFISLINRCQLLFFSYHDHMLFYE